MKTTAFSKTRPRRGCDDDVSLVQSINNGSLDSWHEFLHEFSGLIYSVVRRHLPTESEDDVRTVYVDILKDLYETGLAKYSGRVTLSTWLILVVRRKSLDYWRAQHGRFREPLGLLYLNQFDRKVFRLYYIERFGLDVVAHIVNSIGPAVTTDDVVESIQRIENALDVRYLNRLEIEHRFRTTADGSARRWKYFVQQKMDHEKRSEESAPDSLLRDREKQQILDRLQVVVSKLPPEERRVIDLRFNNGLSAKKISEKLKLGGQRRVYTIINRALRNLRHSMQREAARLDVGRDLMREERL